MDKEIGIRENRETFRNEFIDLVKRNGKVRASLSHTQRLPHHIEASAILDWQWDGELFSITCTGKRVICNNNMPAFHVYKQRW